MSNLRLNKIKAQTPIAILVHGGNRIGYLTARTLIDQGCYVVIIDKFNSSTKKYLTELKKSELFDFFDFRGFSSLFKNLKRFDYLFYFLNQKLTQREFDSKEFLNETKILEESLINTKKNHGKFSLITSLPLNRELANRVNNMKMSAPSPYSNMELQKYCETLTAEFKDKNNLNARILRLGTIIGKGIEKVDNDIIHNLFKDATQKSQITINGEGLDIHTLIHEGDATYGILKLTFTDNTKGEVVSLANKNNYTTLSLAYKLLELDTEAQTIRFVESSDSPFIMQDLYVPAPYATKYGCVQQVSLEEALVEQLQTYYDSINKTWEIGDTTKKKKPIENNVSIGKTKLGEFLHNMYSPIEKIFKKRKESKDIDWKNIFTIFLSSTGVLAFTYFVLYPILGTIIGLLLIGNITKDLTTSVLDFDEQNSLKNIQRLEKNIDRVSTSLDNMYWIFYITNQGELYDNTSQLVLGAQYAIQGSSEMVSAVYPLSEYVRDFEPALDFQTSLPSTTREYREYLEKIENNSYRLDEATYKISLATEIIKNLNTSVFPSWMQDKVLDMKDLISQLEGGTRTIKETVSFLPELLGSNERKRYLILFQNESEIRSTGGWLTSYGIIGIEGGQIRELFVDDIYNADGTLRVQGKRYTPPRSMAKALELTDWSFSLVNWYPDLLDTMSESEQFVKDLGKGNSLDGIITIDISLIQKLLDRWGGIEVPGESELITSKNIYNKIFEMHQEFTPGSTQKTTFLANLANEIVKKVLSMDIPELISISDIFENSLDEKHLQATFKDRNAYNFFNSRSWANSIDSRYYSAPIPIDWNWGGNKANLYLEKNYNLSLNIKDLESIDYTYSITIENSSKTETYPEGNYINYQRIYIPAEATILRINGFENNEYTTYKESGYKVIGGWFNIPVKETKTLEIAYRINSSNDGSAFPIKIQDQNVFFDLNIFKQSGEKKHAYKLDITYPSTWDLENSGNLNSISNQLSGRFELNRNLQFPIVWKVPN